MKTWPCAATLVFTMLCSGRRSRHPQRVPTFRNAPNLGTVRTSQIHKSSRFNRRRHFPASALSAALRIHVNGQIRKGAKAEPEAARQFRSIFVHAAAKVACREEKRRCELAACRCECVRWHGCSVGYLVTNEIWVESRPWLSAVVPSSDW